jgi:peptidoglycan LD-endopeptidase CwlK
MNRPSWPGLLACFFLIFCLQDAFCLDPMKRLLDAYPDILLSAEGNTVRFKDGSEMRWDDGRTGKNYQELLMEPDLEDQFVFPYSAGKAAPAPFAKDRDPGRIRFIPFFQKMYGASQKEVEKNLVVIRWLPKTFNIPLRVTKVNAVDKRLSAVSAELDNLPASLKKFLANPGGTYNYRFVRSEKRLSPHSFGIAIDINFGLSDYWYYDKPDKNGNLHYRNRIPMEIVEIFEKHGFIWGGKWYHYDTMHFEYRPEMFSGE